MLFKNHEVAMKIYKTLRLNFNTAACLWRSKALLPVMTSVALSRNFSQTDAASLLKRNESSLSSIRSLTTQSKSTSTSTTSSERQPSESSDLIIEHLNDGTIELCILYISNVDYKLGIN